MDGSLTGTVGTRDHTTYAHEKEAR